MIIELTKWERKFIEGCTTANIIDLKSESEDLSDYGRETLQLLYKLLAKLNHTPKYCEYE